MYDCFTASPQLASAVALNIVSSSPDSTIFTLTCTSSAFPPTTVTWTRSGQALPTGMCSSYQHLTDAPTSTFNNTLQVNGILAGTYICTVTNDRGSGSREITITGIHKPFLFLGSYCLLFAQYHLGVLLMSDLPHWATIQ